MAEKFNSSYGNESTPELCDFEVTYVVIITINNSITFFLGQPVISLLLWITVTSKKGVDILNFNLAVIHNCQYFLSIVHMITMYRFPWAQKQALRFLLIFSEIGGPMSLCFICLERYIGVIWPTYYPLLKKYRCREFCVVCVWMVSVSPAFAAILVKELHFSSENVLKSLTICLMLVMITVACQSSVSVAWMLRKAGPGRNSLHPAKKRAFKTICATCAIVMFCYIPIPLLQNSDAWQKNTFICSIAPICIFFLSVASVVHPIFYLANQGKIPACF